MSDDLSIASIPWSNLVGRYFDIGQRSVGLLTIPVF